MSNGNKHYDKYYVERNPSTQEVIVNGDKPKLGKLAKHDCPLEERHVKTLNRGWQNSGVYYIEIVPEVIVPVIDHKAVEKALRITLFEEATQLVIDGKLEKAPAKNMKTDDLQKLINENKGE